MIVNTSPHDAFFKKFLGELSVAQDFFQIHLPATVKRHCDFSTLRLCPASFVEDGLRNLHSDMLYSVRTMQGTGYIYCLIEHQSGPDKLIAFRQLRYSLAAMQSHLDQGFKQLPVVIPVLFYQGRRPFSGSTSWLDCFTDRELARQIYTNPFLLIDVTAMSDEQIMTHRRVALFELVQKHIRQRDMMGLANYIGNLLREWPLSLELCNCLIYYIAQVGDTADAKGFFEKMACQAPYYKESFMNIAQRLAEIGRQEGLMMGREQGRQEGREEGKQEGRQEGIQQVARNMLASGVERALIKTATCMSDDELDKLIH